jgi:phage-related protein
MADESPTAAVTLPEISPDAIAQEVLSKIDASAFVEGIKRFADTFDAVLAEVAEIKGRMDTLLHNQKLTYDLSKELNERVKGAAAGRSLAEIEVRVREARK